MVERRKISVPKGTPQPDVLPVQLTRPFPSYDCLSKKEMELHDRVVNDLIDLHDKATIPHHVINYVTHQVSRHGFESVDIFDDNFDKKEKYLFQDPWEQRSMAIVREGQRPITDGFHLIVAHVDSPCIVSKPAPVRRQWDPDETRYHLGTRLSFIAYGGINLHDYEGRQINILGYTIGKDGKKREISFNATTQGVTAHVDDRGEAPLGEAFSHEHSLEVIGGWASPRELRRALGLDEKNDDDFAQTRLWGVLRTDAYGMDEYTWRLFTAGQLDNKVSVYAASKAISALRGKPEYTSIVWLPDNEEIGDGLNTGARGPFLESVLNYIIEKQINVGKITNTNLTSHDKDLMYFNSSMLIADVGIAPSGNDANMMDSESAPKVGLGVFIDASEGYGYAAQAPYIMKLRKLVNGKRKEICHQIAGTSYSGEVAHMSEEAWISGYLIPKGISWANVGVPLAAMHRSAEIVAPSDVLATRRFYERFLSSDIALRKC